MSLACDRCGARADEGARFCSSCGALLRPPSGAERKFATMVFADLVGSTELATGLDPEELRRRLAPFFAVARATLEEHGGTIEKYVGDAVLAVFGVPRAHGDDPDRAVAAALQLADRVPGLDSGLAVRIGVEAGEVLATEGGGDLTVTGEAVNAAARLQETAAPGEVLVGERAAQASRRAVLEPRAPIEARGIPAPLTSWRARSVREQAETPAIPLIGRDEDLDLLRLIYRRAVRERVPELVTIIGEAGIGKTRLANELVSELRQRPESPRVLLGRNPPYGRGIALWALAEILRDAAGLTADARHEEVEQELARLLATLGAEDAEQVAAALAIPLHGERDERAIAEDELKRAWRRLIALLAGERPLVIGIDDAHWADDGLLDLLEEIAFRLQDVPLLLICTSRPELTERRHDFGRSVRNATQIELRPLDGEASTRLAGLLLPEEAQVLASRVAEASGGNPFFAEEVATSLVEDGAAPGARLPDTVQAAIAARIDLLPPAEKRALQYAAVLGESFREQALADLLDQPPREALSGLERRALVQERLASGPGRYAFRHQLICSVAYASLPRAERARLHERAAESLRAQAGERYAELAELVAFHLTQAAELEPTPGRAEEARRATIEAAEFAIRRGAIARAQDLHEQAAALATDSGDSIGDLGAAAEVALRRWRGDHAVRLFREQAATAERAGDPAAAAAGYARAVEVAARMGGITGEFPEEELTAMVARGRELAPPEDIATQTQLLLDDSWLAWRFERDAEMDEPARAAIELARGTGDARLLSSALDALTASSWHQGRYRAAVQHTLERLDLVHRMPRSHVAEIERSDALHMIVESLVQAGDFREAARYASEARGIDLSRGLVYSAWSRALLPAFFLGNWDEVIAMATRVREALIAAESPPAAAFADALSCAAVICGVGGDEAGASEWFEFAEGMKTHQRGGLQMWKAQVELHHGRHREASELLTDADAGSTWWRTLYLATRAEAFACAGATAADEALAEAGRYVEEHPLGQGMVDRARSLRTGEQSAMRDALALFERIECPYQAARTRWLLGGEERDRGRQAFQRLGVVLPP